MEQQTASKLEKEYIKGVYCHPAYLYAECLMQNARLDEVQAGIKIAGRNNNNLRCADDITLMAEREEELNSLLMKVKEESEKTGLKLYIQKTKLMASSPITNRWGNKTVTAFIFLAMKLRHVLLGRKALTNLDSVL